jgi:hypothetical protein
LRSDGATAIRANAPASFLPQVLVRRACQISSLTGSFYAEKARIQAIQSPAWPSKELRGEDRAKGSESSKSPMNRHSSARAAPIKLKRQP